MEILPFLYIVSVAFTGLAKGAGLLPDGPLNAAVGGAVMFATTLTPPENPLISVTWKFGDKDIITSNVLNITGPEYEGRITFFISTGSLELRNLTLNDNGEYSVSITPYAEAQKDSNIRLDVHVPVANVTATASSTDLLEFSHSVSLSCSSSGSSLSFLWLNGSSEVTESDRVQLTNGNSTLTIVNVTRYDQGPFRCHVFNPINNGTSDPVNLSIYFGPENIHLKSPSEVHYEEGSKIALSCSAVSRPAALFYWFLNGDKLSGTGPELTLMNIQMSQSGNYSCQAFNNKTGRYETSQPSVVFVLERISGASVTSSTNLPNEGNSVNLTCDAAGSVFTRMWMKDGSDLILTDDIILYDKNRVLSFNSLNKTDSGEYSCKISNPLSTEEARYIIDVNYGPENVQIIGPTEINLKQTLTLTCSAESTPSASYTWTLNGTEIHNSDVFTKDVTELSDSGNYTCQVKNNITGRASSAVHGLSVTAFKDKTSSCSAGCIAGIVIACLVFLGVAVFGGYCIYKKRNHMKKSTVGNTTTRKEVEGQDNSAYSGSQGLNYATISFSKNKHGETVQLELSNNSTEYTTVRSNNSPPAASQPPSYDAHMRRMPDANGTKVYA